jgi:uncharacterized membrane protein YfcA
MPETSLFWLACLAAWLVGMSKGGLPAIGMLAVPVMALQISPLKAASLLLPIFILTDVFSIWLYRRSFSPENLKLLIPAALLGIFVGWATAAYLSDRWVSLLIGVMGVAFCLNSWLRHSAVADAPARTPSKAQGIFWGALAGFTSFVSHSGGPPFQIYTLPQKMDKMVFVGTSTLFFAAVNLAKLPAYQLLRPYNMTDLQVAAWLVPAALVGTLMGAWLTRRMNGVWFYRLVHGGLFVVSLKLVWGVFSAA